MCGGRPGSPATSGGGIRKLIVTSLVSLNGIHGDRQSWLPDFLGDQARGEGDASWTWIRRHDEYA
jgi:hypothetical protein